MTKPLALLCYEKLLPGSQLITRLEDLGYRVHALLDAHDLAQAAEKERPMVLAIDLTSVKNDICAQIKRIHENPKTNHLPVLAFGPSDEPELQSKAIAAGAKVVIGEEAVLQHLPQLLERALEIEQ